MISEKYENIIYISVVQVLLLCCVALVLILAEREKILELRHLMRYCLVE